MASISGQWTPRLNGTNAEEEQDTARVLNKTEVNLFAITIDGVVVRARQWIGLFIEGFSLVSADYK